MSGPEHSSLAFFIRIWVEQTSAEVDGGSWRGHITSLPDQERRYVESLAEIIAFIHERFELIGIDGGDNASHHSNAARR